MSHRRGLKSDSTCLLAGAVRLIKTNGMHRFRWGRRHLLARQPDRSGKVHTATKAPDSLQPGTLARARVHTFLIEEQSQGGAHVQHAKPNAWMLVNGSGSFPVCAGPVWRGCPHHRPVWARPMAHVLAQELHPAPAPAPGELADRATTTLVVPIHV